METKKPLRIRSITAFHKLWGLNAPAHPLISILEYADIARSPLNIEQGIMLACYAISIKRIPGVKMIYGQQKYDFDEGVMFFMAPNQLLRIEAEQHIISERSGWILFIHPDFFWGTALAKAIKHFEFFNYAANEALFLSEKEEAIITQIIHNIKQEYHANIDKFSQNIIVSQIETLLNYSDRFYQRQFITRKITNHRILDRFENFLSTYFNGDELLTKGQPSVQQISHALGVSPSYLSALLKVLTGQSTQQHIQDKVVEKAKEKLSTTDLSISEIAYELGFEYPQSLSKLFKAKTNQSPLAFRQSFN